METPMFSPPADGSRRGFVYASSTRPSRAAAGAPEAPPEDRSPEDELNIIVETLLFARHIDSSRSERDGAAVVSFGKDVNENRARCAAGEQRQVGAEQQEFEAPQLQPAAAACSRAPSGGPPRGAPAPPESPENTKRVSYTFLLMKTFR
ncbi:hypothetical protein EYF80_054698 [Liparis tanakae]|uniref:Uncharacterized protein n=1 Tax=Liparis tanakae TaxID=230148 RepID=A0A4Z2F1Q4_9TELE|nr:hypothetical protein EYF80_054698 [Liparis tanakae]